MYIYIIFLTKTKHLNTGFKGQQFKKKKKKKKRLLCQELEIIIELLQLRLKFREPLVVQWLTLHFPKQGVGSILVKELMSHTFQGAAET